MSDDEREPGGAGGGAGDDGEPTPRPLGALAAFGWSSVGLFAAIVIVNLSVALRPGLERDIVNNAACTALGLSLAMVAALFVHLPDLEVPDALGVRPANPLLFGVAALVGVVLQGPATWIASVIERRFPRPQAELDLLAAVYTLPTGMYRVVFATLAVALGPLGEELLFRGVLLRGLRRGYARTLAVLVSATCFSLAHADPRRLAPIMLCGLVLGHLRERAGSLGPSLLAHMTFNAVTTFALLAGWSSMDELTTRVPFVLGTSSVVLLLVLLALYTWLAERSPLAAEAREADAS